MVGGVVGLWLVRSWLKRLLRAWRDLVGGVVGLRLVRSWLG